MRDMERPLAQLHASISSFLSSDVQHSLTRSKEHMAVLAAQIQVKMQAKKHHSDKLLQLHQELAEQNDYERSLNSERRIRENKREIQLLQVSMDPWCNIVLIWQHFQVLENTQYNNNNNNIP